MQLLIFDSDLDEPRCLHSSTIACLELKLPGLQVLSHL